MLWCVSASFWRRDGALGQTLLPTQEVSLCYEFLADR